MKLIIETGKTPSIAEVNTTSKNTGSAQERHQREDSSIYYKNKEEAMLYLARQL
ncbi:MAG: hypothetical protein J7L38_01285 [Thermoproteales archaeon]|nr:hypothetical protein [Thermoproteales archaeon]